MIRIFQLLHLFLIVLIAGAYSWLMATLPSDDRWRVRVSAIVGTALAIWSALIFVASLRSGEDEDTFRQRFLAAYRRWLTEGSTLLVSTVALAMIAALLISVGARFGEIEFAAAAGQKQDVSVVLSDDGKAPQRLLVVGPGKRTTVRVPLGRHWLYFAAADGPGPYGTPYRTKVVDILPLWRKHDLQTVTIPEVPTYVAQ